MCAHRYACHLSGYTHTSIPACTMCPYIPTYMRICMQISTTYTHNSDIDILIHTYTYLHTDAHLYIPSHLYMYVHPYVRACTRIWLRTICAHVHSAHARIRVHTYACTACIYMHALLPTHMCTHTYLVVHIKCVRACRPPRVSHRRAV